MLLLAFCTPAAILYLLTAREGAKRRTPEFEGSVPVRAVQSADEGLERFSSRSIFSWSESAAGRAPPWRDWRRRGRGRMPRSVRESEAE